MRRKVRKDLIEFKRQRWAAADEVEKDLQRQSAHQF